MDASELSELLDELPAPSKGRPGKAVQHFAVREMTDDDLTVLRESPPAAQPSMNITALRHSHHQVAQLVAKGVAGTEIALLSGYTVGYVYLLQKNPMFMELVEHYKHQREMAFVDVAERMKTLGLSALDELQARLADDPNGWTKRELQELAKLTLIDGQGLGTAGKSGGTAGAGVNIAINFVKPAQASGEPTPLILDGNGEIVG